MSRSLEKPALILAMSLGTLLLWTAVPALWVWIAGRTARVSQSDMSSFALIFIGIPITMVVVGKGLVRLERRYTERYDLDARPRSTRARWLQSLRGDTPDESATMLDKILIINVALALITATIWFALFSGGGQVPRN